MRAKNIFTIISVLIPMFITPALVYSSNNGDIEGTWEGTIKTSEQELRIILKIWREADGTLKATGDNPDQESWGIPLDDVTFKNGNLHFEAKPNGGVFEGKMKRDGSTIEGKLQGQDRLSFIVVKRVVDKATIQPKNRSEDFKVQESENQLSNHINDKEHTTTSLTLILALIGLVGMIIFIGIKLNRR